MPDNNCKLAAGQSLSARQTHMRQLGSVHGRAHDQTSGIGTRPAGVACAVVVCGLLTCWGGLLALKVEDVADLEMEED